MQKTACVMRISDWSSDVFSSDLRNCATARSWFPTTSSAQSTASPTANKHEWGSRRRPGSLPGRRSHLASKEQTHDGEDAVASEIGRASCRERVCQYV